MRQNFKNYLTGIFTEIPEDTLSIKWEHTEMEKEKSENKWFIGYYKNVAQMEKSVYWVKWYQPTCIFTPNLRISLFWNSIFAEVL